MEKNKIIKNNRWNLTYIIVKYILGVEIMLIDILQVLFGFILGAVLGFFISRKLMTKYLKKNPPINEEMIRTLMSGMGRTPTQKQVNQMMKQMQKYM